MSYFVKLLSIIVTTVCLYSSCCGFEFEEELAEEDDKWPTIGISILVKNKAHALPYSLTCLQKMDYPKDRQYIWIFIDNNIDNSVAIIDTWTKIYKKQYKDIYITTDKNLEPRQKVAKDDSQWTTERLQHLIKLREKAFAFARSQWADYIFMMDADVFLTEPMTLKLLVSKKLPIVAPMLISDGLYSNFWDGMSDKYYYEKTNRYEEINDRIILGCFKVPMVHTAVLIDLRKKKSDLLSYDPTHLKEYKGPTDDIIAFAVSASQNGVPMSVCNDREYGFLPVPVDINQTPLMSNEWEQLLNVKMEALSQGVELPLDQSLAKFVSYPPKEKLGLDRIFLINLKRRYERRHLMELSFKELGIEATIVEAVDGMKMDMNDLSKYGVTLLPNYEDPYHKRPMKAGEVGCFLSHFSIWKEIATRSIRHSLVLEDDIRFAPFFRRRFQELMQDLEMLDWDLVYIGRKILLEGEEHVTPRVAVPLYSYWTLGYLISEAGARKLIQAEPLSKMVPVDEFLPIMFDRHPNDTWMSYFRRRDLKAFSASPLLVSPTHYTGQPGYVSDTEDSIILAPDGEMAQWTRLDDVGTHRLQKSTIPRRGDLWSQTILLMTAIKRFRLKRSSISTYLV